MARSKVYKSKPKPVEEELPSDDEIDAFDKQKDFISLDAAKESESDDAEDDGLYDLSDDADDSSDDEFDSDDSDAEGGTLGRRKCCSQLTTINCSCGGLTPSSGEGALRLKDAQLLLQSSALKKLCATS